MPIPIEDDLANVLTIVQRIFTGPRDVRDQIDRVLARYTDEQLIDFEQLTADRLFITGMVRDGLAMSQERVVINGIPIPF